MARGDLLGPDQPIRLVLLDIPPLAAKLTPLLMELEDCGSRVLAGATATVDVATAFTGVDIALLVGSRPRGPGMERSDLLAANAAIFRTQGDALNRLASRDVRVVVVGNPANTNALIAAKSAPSLPPTAFTSLTRLDQSRAVGLIGRRLGVACPASHVSGVVIWGNHSTTQFPDARYATISGLGARPQDSVGVPGALGAAGDAAWLHGDFVTAVQQRGKEVIDARGASSAASAAEAIVAHTRDWLLGSGGVINSMGEGVWCMWCVYWVRD